MCILTQKNVIKVDRGVSIIPAIPTCTWTSESLVLHTGGSIQETDINFRMKPVIAHIWNIKNPSFPGIEYKLKPFKNITLEDIGQTDGKWESSFFKNVLKQKYVEDKLKQHKEFSKWPTALSIISTAMIVLLIILCLTCFCFKKQIFKKLLNLSKIEKRIPNELNTSIPDVSSLT